VCVARLGAEELLAQWQCLVSQVRGSPVCAAAMVLCSAVAVAAMSWSSCGHKVQSVFCVARRAVGTHREGVTQQGGGQGGWVLRVCMSLFCIVAVVAQFGLCLACLSLCVSQALPLYGCFFDTVPLHTLALLYSSLSCLQTCIQPAPLSPSRVVVAAHLSIPCIHHSSSCHSSNALPSAV
jgi:hypothetical protein